MTLTPEIIAIPFLIHGTLQPLPQKYYPSRLGLFFFLIKIFASKIKKKAPNASFITERLADLGLINFIFISLGRFFPQIVHFPGGLLGKQPNGKISFLSKIFWAPYLILEKWNLNRVAQNIIQSSKKILDPYNLVYSSENDGEAIYLGMHPYFFKNNFPPNIEVIFDLSNEFEEDNIALKNRKYINVPVWDQALPLDKERFVDAVDEVSHTSGNLYVHCAFGLGRSSLAVAAILLKRNIVKTVQEAYDLIRKARPMTRWKDEQFEFMSEILHRLT